MACHIRRRLPLRPRLCGRSRNLVILTSGQQCPGDPCHLVRQRNRDQHSWLPRQHAREPGASRRASAGRPPHHRHGADDRAARRRSRCPIFETRPSRALPAEECCRGDRVRSQAAKSRPLPTSPCAAQSARRSPGMLISRRTVSSLRARSPNLSIKVDYLLLERRDVSKQQLAHLDHGAGQAAASGFPAPPITGSRDRRRWAR